jgi:ABC-type phosphate/phosphonate transport system substrate-binding protein
MKYRSRLSSTSFALACGLTLGFMPAAEAEKTETRPNTVYIGMVSTLFPSTPEKLLTAVLDSFGALMESQTGVPGRIVPVTDPVQLGQMLVDNKVKLGVFHGVEFGWAKQKYPSLSPLMIAVNQDRHLEAMVVVREDKSGKNIGDVKGKTLAISKNMRHHCRLFLERRCQELGKDPTEFFGEIETLPNSEKALDQLIDGKVDCTLVDSLSMQCYQRLKPVRFAKLKALERSPIFPTAVVAFHPGSLDDATLKKFRQGMMDANKTMQGRHMMTLFRLTGFEPIPTDYEQMVSNILRVYPTPSPCESATESTSEKK